MPREFVKDPAARLDYLFDWGDWLDGDTIASHTVTVSAGLTLVSTTATATAVTAWLSGGTANQSYTATCHIVTAAGREDDRTATVMVMDR